MLLRIAFQAGVLYTLGCTILFFSLEDPEWQNRKLENLSKDRGLHGFKLGVGNRQSSTGHIDCTVIFSGPHLLQICKFCRKNTQF